MFTTRMSFIYAGATAQAIDVPWVQRLSDAGGSVAAILLSDLGSSFPPGLYVRTDNTWRLGMRAPELNAVVGTASIWIYTNMSAPVSIPGVASVYVNGTKQAGSVVGADSRIWCVVQSATSQDNQVIATIDAAVLADASLGMPALDHTLALQAAIDACPANCTLVMPNRNWRFTNLVVTSSIIIDWNGSNLVVDPTPAGLTTGNPAIWVKGANTTNYTISNMTTTSSSVTCATPAQAANFPAGTLVRIKDSKRVYNWADLDSSGTADPTSSDAAGAPGYQDRWETNWVVASDPQTGIIILARPTEWAYDASPTISKINPLMNPGIININSMTEVDPGGVFNGVDIQNAPHLIKFDYCVRPLVQDVTASYFNLQAVNFDTCESPRAFRVTAMNPYRPTTGGHGYAVRFNRSFDGLAREIRGIAVRHLVDHTQTYACGSENCSAWDTVISSYAFHGLGERRCFSRGDHHYASAANPGGVGWVIGNPSFAGAYSTRVESPTFVGAGTGAIIGYLSDDTQILNPSFRGVVPVGSGLQFRGVLVIAGATNTVIRGGHIDGQDVKVIGSELITARNNYTLSDTIAVKPDSLWIDSVILTGPFGDAATSMYSLHISQCSSTKVTNCTFVSVANTQQGVDLLMDSTNNSLIFKGNTFRGPTRKYGLQVQVAPVQTYRIEDNVSESAFNIRYLDLVVNNLLREEGNAAVTTNVLTYGATITLDLTLNAAGGRPSEKTLNTVTLTGNAQLANVAATGLGAQAVRHGKRYVILIKQDATGSRLLTYQSQYKFAGAAPTLSTAANAIDRLEMVWDQVEGCFFCTLQKAYA